jgi:hypothetical protein
MFLINKISSALLGNKKAATDINVPIMLPSWVDEVWNLSAEW